MNDGASLVSSNFVPYFDKYGTPSMPEGICKRTPSIAVDFIYMSCDN
jgi:hypothetical protein